MKILAVVGARPNFMKIAPIMWELQRRSGITAHLVHIEQLQREMPVVFPVHPRTRKAMNGTANPAMPNLRVTDPLGYLDFMKLVANARVVLTDSGGIQEETTVLGVPCLTLRETTERPLTVTEGTNTVVGRDPSTIVAVARR